MRTLIIAALLGVVPAHAQVTCTRVGNYYSCHQNGAPVGSGYTVGNTTTFNPAPQPIVPLQQQANPFGAFQQGFQQGLQQQPNYWGQD